jgi:hypothetical protein
MWLDDMFDIRLVSRNNYQYAVVLAVFTLATVLCLCSVWLQCYAANFFRQERIATRLNPAALSLSGSNLAFGATRDPATFAHRKTPSYGSQPGSAFHPPPQLDLSTAPTYKERRQFSFAGL